MKNPTNGELAIMIQNLSSEMREGLKRVEDQTTKTNGRVTKLEETKNMAIGGLVLTNIIIVPIFITMIIKYVIK